MRHERLSLAQQLLDDGDTERAMQFADGALYPVNTFGMNILNTLREKNVLEDLWASGKAPWKKW